jgi:hypothetical protein
MTDAADLVLTNGEVHTLAEPGTDGAEPTPAAEAVAVRDGRIVRVGSDYEVSFLAGVETETVDLDGATLLPGFVDAHTHMTTVGRFAVHADLRGAASREAAVDRLAERAAGTDPDEQPYVLGYGYDESTWGDGRYLAREDLDAVSTDRPVIAFREDLHTASLNGVALARHRGEMADADVETAGGDPTGVVVEDALEVLFDATRADRAETRTLLEAATARAAELGVTCVHDMVRRSHAPRVYREMAADGALPVRVRLNYWTDHLDAVAEAGLTTGSGNGMVRVGAIKSYTDGSIGGRTAKLSAPYADGDDGEDGPTAGRWVVDPRELADLVDRATDAGFGFAAHAIGDEAIRATLDVYESVDDAPAPLRIEHVEVTPDALVERLGAADAVVSMQPNFLKWARPDGLYESRLGAGRTAATNRFRDLLDAGAELAFGSDSMPMGPLFGIQQTVTAPHGSQRLGVTEALRAYTRGAAAASGDDGHGRIEAGAPADLVALSASPWAVDRNAIADVDPVLTVVDGEVVHRAG